MEGKENRTLSREAKAEGRVDAKPPKKPGGFSFAKLGQKRRENLVAQGLVPADVPVETFIRAGGAVEKRVVQPPPSPEPAALLRARAALAADGAANVRNADVRKEAARQRLRRTQSLRVVCRVLNACATRLMSRQLERGFRSLYVLFLNRRAVFTRAALDAAHATGRESEARAAAARDKAAAAEARALEAEEARAASDQKVVEAEQRARAAEEAQKGADERAAAAEAKTHEAEARLLEALRTATEANERCAAAERRAAAAEGRARVAQQLADAAEAKPPSMETATSPIPEVRASLRQSLAELRGEASSVKGRKTPPSSRRPTPKKSTPKRKASPAPKKATPKLATEARAPEVAPAAPPAAPPTTPHARPPPELRDDLAAQYRALLASNGCPAPAPRDATADELWGLLDQERRRDGGAPLSPPAPPVARGAPASRTPPTSPYAEQQKSPYVVELKKAPGLFVVSAWAEEDKKKWPAPVGTAVVFCNRQLYSPELAKKRLARAAQKQAALEVGDRVSAKVAIRYARDAEGSAVPIGDDAAPEAIILPGAGGAVMSVDGSGAKFLKVRWDDHDEDLGDALVKADDVDAVAEVVFRFWTHATVEYAYQAGAGSGLGGRWARPRVVVGTGSWFRTSRDATRDTAHKMFVKLRKKYDATIVLLSDVEEASFEETATLYAHKEKNLELPDAIISCGSGSTQASCVAPADIGDIVEAPAKLWKHLGLEDGKATVVHRWHSECSHVYEDHHGAKVEHFDESKDYWGYVYDIEFSGRRGLYRVDNIERVIKRQNGATRQSTPHLIQCGNREGQDIISKATTVNAGVEVWSTRIESKFANAGFNRDSFITTCTLMGACFHAAKYAEVPLTGKTVKIVQAKFEAAIRKIKNEAASVERDEQTETTKQTLIKIAENFEPDVDKKTDMLQTLSNLMVQVRICKMLGDDVKVRYVRDWDLDGVKFRTTWSAGYYLQDLVHRHPDLLAAKSTGFENLI